MSLSNRAVWALKILREGGEAVYRLEPKYVGWRHKGDFWKWRLKAAGGAMVSGFGHATAHELIAAGLLVPAKGGTTVSSYYKLKEED